MIQTVVAKGLPAPVQTPLVRAGNLWIKAEGRQRTESAKYRMVHAKIVRAIDAGEISARTTLIEVTSGSTGLALAFVGKYLGVPVELHAYRTIAPAKRAAIEELGARLVLHEADVSVGQLLAGARKRVAEGGYWHLDQYDRRSTTQAYEPLERETVAQLTRSGAPYPTVFLCPVGSGGLIQGVGSFLRRDFPDIRVIALEPKAGERIDGIRNTEVSYLGDGDPYDRRFPNEVVRVAPPAEKVTVGSVELGESGSAAVVEATAREWGPTLILAPD